MGKPTKPHLPSASSVALLSLHTRRPAKPSSIKPTPLLSADGCALPKPASPASPSCPPGCVATPEPNKRQRDRKPEGGDSEQEQQHEAEGERRSHDEAREEAGCGRQRLQRHWIQVAGHVTIPERWGREQHLKEWVGFGIVEEAMRPAGLLSARSAMVRELQERGQIRRSPAAGPSPAALLSRSADVRVS